MARIPPGFKRLPRRSNFMALLGPMYERREGGSYTLGMRVTKKHGNTRGLCHGGMLASFADVALGYTMSVLLGRRGAMVTASLNIDYAGSAKIGDWIESVVDVQKMGARLAFVNCYLVADGKRIVRASAIFAHTGPVAGAQ